MCVHVVSDVTAMAKAPTVSPAVCCRSPVTLLCMSQSLDPVPATTDNFSLCLMTCHDDVVHHGQVRITPWRFSDLSTGDRQFVHTRETEDVVSQFSLLLLEVGKL